MKVKLTPSSTSRIPSVDECLEIMEHHGMLFHIRSHSILVARVAAIMAEALNRKGWNLDIPSIVAGALLHDIAKTRSLQGGNHAEMGRKIVLEMGYPEVARIVGSHVDCGSEIPCTINEALLVNYADKRVQHDRVVSLKERFKDLLARYGKTPAKRTRFREMARNMERLEKQIFSQISPSPEDLESMIKRPPDTYLPEDLMLKGGRKRGTETEGRSG